MISLRILVVEDNLENMDLICLILEKAGHQVYKAYDGIKGVELAFQEQPDLMLLDLALPVKDGFTVAEEIKSSIITRNIPIIAISVHSFPEFKNRALKSGCDAFIQKPFSLKALNQEVNRFSF